MTEPDAKIGGRVAGVGGISFLVGIYVLETRGELVMSSLALLLTRLNSTLRRWVLSACYRTCNTTRANLRQLASSD